MKKTKLKVGDIVMVYKYQEDMTFSFTKNMKEYIGKICRVVSINETPESIGEMAIHLEPISWNARECGWNWSESVLKKLSREEALMELI